MSPPTRTRTSWMDGLRGLASLMVFNFHYLAAYSHTSTVGYGANNLRHWFQLPPFRLVYDGQTCVDIFFIVSGYVCTAKAFQLMTTGHVDKALQNLTNSIFKRFFRLYLPVFCITLLTALFTYLGIMEFSRPMWNQKSEFFYGPFSEDQLVRFASITAQLKFWAFEMLSLINPWHPKAFYPQHDPHLWTIRYEFRMSMHLYITTVGVSACKPAIRIAILILIGCLYGYWGRWEGPMFFYGAALAQFDALHTGREGLVQWDTTPAITSKPTQPDKSLQPPKPISGPSRARSRPHTRIASAIRLSLYVVGIYLMCFPIANTKKPALGYRWVNAFIPHFYSKHEAFPKSIGVIIVFTLLSFDARANAQLPSPAHRLLASRPAQHLGKIMFAFYLVHGPVMHVFGYYVPHVVWRIVGKETAPGFFVGFFIGWAVTLMTCLGAAYLFTQYIDAGCARIVRRLEVFCFTGVK